jgi:hypothetical protein
VKVRFHFDLFTVSVYIIPDIMPDVIADIIPDITYSLSCQSVQRLGCLNNDRYVMSKSYALRPLAIFLILKGSVCTVTDEDWLRHRRLELYHRTMDHIIWDIDLDKLCSRDIYIRFADDKL